jgi:hypothetical protein
MFGVASAPQNMGLPWPNTTVRSLSRCAHLPHPCLHELGANAADIAQHHVQATPPSLHSHIQVLIIIPYAPQRSHMAPQMAVCLYPCGGATCAPMAMGGIPPESQVSWLSGRLLIMSFWLRLLPVRSCRIVAF